MVLLFSLIASRYSSCPMKPMHAASESKLALKIFVDGADDTSKMYL
jgi:hypothetical protein